MAKAKNKKPLDKIAPLVGKWRAADPWETDIVLTISRKNGALSVSAIDQSDGEKAEVMNLKVEGGVLTFATYWSSGQLTKYRVRERFSDLEAVFTYTDTTTFVRVAPKR